MNKLLILIALWLVLSIMLLWGVLLLTPDYKANGKLDACIRDGVQEELCRSMYRE